MKSFVVLTSGTTAFLNLPTFASYAFRPSKKTRSSPSFSASAFTSFGFRCFPPPTTPCSLTRRLSGTPKETNSGRAFTLKRGKSEPVPSDHLKSIFLKPGYCFVALMYFLRLLSSPPRVPLIPCLEIKIRPLRLSISHSVCCHSRTASGSATGANP